MKPHPKCFGCNHMPGGIRFAPCDSHRIEQAAAHVAAAFSEPRSIGAWHVEPFELTQQEVDMARLRGAMSGAYAEVYDLRAGRYVRLVRGSTRPTAFDRTVVMSTTPMELRTMGGAIARAHGRVLIGGLGLGVVSRAVASLRRVESVSVVERAQEVIDLVGPSLPLNIEIIPGDVETWTPPAGARYDFVYLDIWDDVPNGDVWPQMKRLRRRFKRWAPAKDSVRCWREERARKDP